MSLAINITKSPIPPISTVSFALPHLFLTILPMMNSREFYRTSNHRHIDMPRPFDEPAQTGHRETTLPAAVKRGFYNLDHRIDQHRQRRGVVEHLVGIHVVRRALARRLEHDDSQRNVNLGCRQTRAIGVDHGLDHVGHEPADFGSGGVFDLLRALGQDRVPHLGDFQDSHGPNMGSEGPLVKELVGFSPKLAPAAGGQAVTRLISSPTLENGQERQTLQIIVRDNNIDQALKALKKKMQREGIFREMKLRGHYEKPSVKRARERAEAVRRYRKLQRKRAQREGSLPK